MQNTNKTDQEEFNEILMDLANAAERLGVFGSNKLRMKRFNDYIWEKDSHNHIKGLEQNTKAIKTYLGNYRDFMGSVEELELTSPKNQGLFLKKWWRYFKKFKK